jgi:hypothetical protein
MPKHINKSPFDWILAVWGHIVICLLNLFYLEIYLSMQEVEKSYILMPYMQTHHKMESYFWHFRVSAFCDFSFDTFVHIAHRSCPHPCLWSSRPNDEHPCGLYTKGTVSSQVIPTQDHTTATENKTKITCWQIPLLVRFVDHHLCLWDYQSWLYRLCRLTTPFSKRSTVYHLISGGKSMSPACTR